MKRSRCGGFLLEVFTLYVSIASVGQVWAQDRGDPIVGLDAGQKIEEAAAEEEGSSLWAWVLGIGGAVVAGVAAYLIADQDTDDAEDAATAAQASASAAETSAADAAAAAAPPAEQQFKYRVHITGTFNAAAGDYRPQGASVALMAPSITFQVPTDTFPGGISGYTSSATGVASGLGGDYEQVSDKSVLIRVDDVLYLGIATTLSQTKILLSNGIVLSAGPGAGVYLYKIPE